MGNTEKASKHSHTYTHKHIHTYTHTHINTNTHTHTYTCKYTPHGLVYLVRDEGATEAAETAAEDDDDDEDDDNDDEEDEGKAAADGDCSRSVASQISGSKGSGTHAVMANKGR